MFYLRVAALFLWTFFCLFFGSLATFFARRGIDWNQKIGRILGWGGLKIAGIKLEEQENTPFIASQPCVYIANHQSAFDVITCTAFFPPNTLIIGKKELFWIPVFGLLFKRAGNIFIDRKNRSCSKGSLDQAVEKIKAEKKSIFIFPEGTRNDSNQAFLPFKRGAFHLAIETGVPIVPIVVAALNPLFCWKKRFLKSGVLKYKVLPPFDTDKLNREHISLLNKEVRDKMLAAYERLNA
jgi:1-acyl-sn-glycerol-3-phosphate acyltransferase